MGVVDQHERTKLTLISRQAPHNTMTGMIEALKPQFWPSLWDEWLSYEDPRDVVSQNWMPVFARGDRIKVQKDKRWWTVRAVDQDFVVITRQAEFEAKGVTRYAIIDWKRGVRGPCNLIGQGWDTDTQEGCDELLAALRAHVDNGARRQREFEESDGKINRWPVDDIEVEVSYRNNVPISFYAYERNDPAGVELNAALFRQRWLAK